MGRQCDECWFVVLPDREAATAVGERLRGRACQVVRHASGRPWLVGCWGPEQITVVSCGAVRLAVAGACSLGGDDLVERLRVVRTVADVESVVADAAGSFHLVASLDGQVYARGSLSQAQRLYRAVLHGVTVVADRARTLAWLTGADVDVAQLAARLAYPDLPYPVAGGALWRGVRAVPGGEAVHLDDRGGCRTARWWSAPPAELPLALGAPPLRQALMEAVAVRVVPGQVLGADLSGGLDSTSLCFLAAHAGARLVTATMHWAAPGNEDATYADRAATQLPGIERLIFRPGDLPAHFTGLSQPREPGDEPTALLRDRAQQQQIAAAMRAAGAHQRLNGHGGDHVVEAPAQYLHRLVRRHPLLGMRHAAGYRARDRWSLRATARTLLDTRSYPAWLADTARSLRQPDDRRFMPSGWGTRVALPPWASEQAREQLTALLRTAAREAVPLTGDRDRHAWIHHAQNAGRSAGHLTHDAASVGLLAASPFCDDAVITACLAVAPHAATNPWSYKPLLVAAMRGLVPDQILTRTSKDGCGTEWYAGLKEHQADFAVWAADSHLVFAGLADEAGLRRVLLSPGLLNVGAAALEFTLGAEAWLRDVAAHPTPGYLKEHSDEPATTR